jgi:hypothetical protein
MTQRGKTDSDPVEVHFPGLAEMDLQIGNLIRRVEYEGPDGKWWLRVELAAKTTADMAAVTDKLLAFYNELLDR